MTGEAGRRGERKAFWRRWRRGQHAEHTMKHFNVGDEAQSTVWTPGFVRAHVQGQKRGGETKGGWAGWGKRCLRRMKLVTGLQGL